MVEFLNILVAGVVTGAVYGLLAVGFSLVFNVTGVLNLAQGAFVTMGALVMYTLRSTVHLPMVVAFLGSATILTAVMAVVEWVIIRPAVLRISHTSLLMLMGGLLTAFEGAAFLIWGSNPYILPAFSGSTPFDIGGVFVATQDIWVVGVAALSVTVLWLFLTRTKIGTAFRATAENRMAARLMGISADKTTLLSFSVSALIGVIAGAVIFPLTSLDYTSMATYTNLGLIAVTLGGLGSIFGAAIGGVVFGIVEAVVSGYISALFGTAISLLILIGMLLWRPQGLLGKIRGARADIAESRGGRILDPIRLERRTSRTGIVGVGAAMIVLPLALSGSGDMAAINITGVFCLTIVGLELLTGVAGQVSLGQAGFMAVGGYTSSVLIVQHNWPPLLALLGGVVASAIVAVILGLAGSRVRGMYLAIVTLSFGILVQSVASGLSFTGGPSGLAGIPSFSVGGFSFGTDTRFFYLIWGLVAVALLISGNLVRSNRGRMLRAMHGDDVGARSLGLNLFRTKVAVFVISAVIASVAGTLYACYFHYLSPDMVGSSVSLSLITMLVVGGNGTWAGPLVGAALLTFFPQLSQGVKNYEPLIDGGLLILFLRFLPAGVYGGIVVGLRSVTARLRRPTARGQIAPLDAMGVEESPAKLVPVVPASTGADELKSGDLLDARSKDGGLGHGGNGATIASIAPSGAPALRVQNIGKSFGGVWAVADVSLEVPVGSIAALIGPNGAGKSTLFNLVTNLYRPDKGQVELHGEVITGLRPDVIARRGLFRTFQTSRVFGGLTVLENAMVGGYRFGRASYVSQSLWTPKASREEADLHRRARAILEVVGLADVADQPAHTLPLAAQKYLDVARAMMSRADVLLFDEPGAGMNDAETMELGALLLAVRDAGHTILVVDHNMALVMGIADKVTVMDRGSVIADGVPAAVQSDPLVAEAYFGQAQGVA